MKKQLLTGLVAITMAMGNVMASTLNWLFLSDTPMAANGEFYLYNLGAGGMMFAEPNFMDSSFNPDTKHLRATDGREFSATMQTADFNTPPMWNRYFGEGENEQLIIQYGGNAADRVQGTGYLQGIPGINDDDFAGQWWAVVVVSGDMWGIDVFEIEQDWDYYMRVWGMEDISNTELGGGGVTMAYNIHEDAFQLKYQIVPEPATGTLALAGIALLFARRRRE